jgi:hypothetical protein
MDGSQILFERDDSLGHLGLKAYFIFSAWVDGQLGDKTGIKALVMHA